MPIKTLGVSLLCFNNEQVLKRSLKNLLKLDTSAFNHVDIHIFDPGYPLRDKSRFRDMARTVGGHYYEMVNKGQTLNIKATVPYLQKYDYVLAWEPDADIRSINYLNAAIEAARGADADYIVPMCEDWVYGRQGTTHNIAGDLECKEITFQGGWPQVLYTKKAWEKLSNLVPSCKGPYGGTEYDIWKALQPLKGIMLRNYRDHVDQSGYDPSFQTWKRDTIGKDNQPFFEETLKP